MKALRLPPWLRRQLPQKSPHLVADIVKKYNLSTVCDETQCPNRSECFSKKTATFLALGKMCTRNCAFCNIRYHSTPPFPDSAEPNNIANCAKKLKLSYVVITMVTRDDLEDGGAKHIAKIVKTLKRSPLKIEVLTSDFGGSIQALETVLKTHPDVFNHNLETVETLTPKIRHRAEYRRSLRLLQHAKTTFLFSGLVKSGLMVGLGETKEQVKQTLTDLAESSCDIVTIGQYLQPHPKKWPVKEFIPLTLFQEYQAYGHSVGIKHVLSGPFVRSSYLAQEASSI